MLTKSIIVSGISNLSDARYCSGMGVEYLGVCIDPSNPSYLTIERFNEINGWLSGINWILETESTDVEEILAACKVYEVAGVFAATAEIANKLIENNVKVLINEAVSTISISDNNVLGIVADYNELHSTIREAANLPLYIRGDLSIKNLESIRENEAIAGVILAGGIEERPGFKNMDDLIDALEVFEE